MFQKSRLFCRDVVVSSILWTRGRFTSDDYTYIALFYHCAWTHALLDCCVDFDVLLATLIIVGKKPPNGYALQSCRPAYLLTQHPNACRCPVISLVIHLKSGSMHKWREVNIYMHSWAKLKVGGLRFDYNYHIEFNISHFLLQFVRCFGLFISHTTSHWKKDMMKHKNI